MNPNHTEPVVIVCGADDGYTIPLAAMIKSVLTNINTEHPILLYVVDAGISEENKRKLLKSWSSGRLTVSWVTVDDSALSNLPLWGRMRINAYDRLMMPDFLPASLHKAIWLDSDLIVEGNLAELWEIDLRDKALLAVQDMVVPYAASRYGITPHKELGIPGDAKCFNSGVMVVNLDWWRRNDVTQKVTGYLRKYGDTVVFWDQEGLNAILVDQWVELDPRWNQIASVSGRSFFRPEHLDSEKYEQVVKEPRILHFAGALKPWIYRNNNPSRDVFFKYLDMTELAGWRPRRTFKSITLGIYESTLRDTLYPAEKWVIKLLRKLPAKGR